MSDKSFKDEPNKEKNYVKTYLVDKRTYDLRYPYVQRGEAYWCDLGLPYGSEQGGIRPVIIIQNDVGNRYSPTTIVMACTSKRKATLPVHYPFTFSNETMDTCLISGKGKKKNTLLAEDLYKVDKTRLRDKIGKMNDEFMKKVDELIKISLGLCE